ncbi:MAG: NAD(P)/FAD-dependent oxidoreductase [Burkholderiales bacterium]|nr:NAD(P)/FAD-dependent oxidoreductase [Burkholderiales bacterium]
MDNVTPLGRAEPAPGSAAAVDVLIVGAGLSGIGAAYHLQQRCPGKSYLILEGRDTIGGTWDLFRYPGVRSDSDMHTLGYRFRPWREAKAIADGPSILRYIRDTARENGIERHICFGQQVVQASWSSAEARWSVDTVGPGGRPQRFTARVLHMCSGYYDYTQGYLPQWPGTEQYRGRWVHPQQWPEQLDTRAKRVLVIGSGATAVTLVPELAKTAAKVVMLQRSPTFIVTRPAEDGIANFLHRWLPAGVAHFITRWKNVLRGQYFYQLARRKPERVAKVLVDWARAQLPKGYDVERHFTPRYKPWDQRICLVPDGDLFAAIRGGRAEVVTDEIDTFTTQGVRLKSGAEIAADIIVTATGLQMKVLGGLRLLVDGQPVDLRRPLTYKGMMYSDIPNLSYSFGYTNASWTLKCDLTAEYLCRMIRYLDRHGHDYFVPRRTDPTVTEESAFSMTSGYLQRAADILPRQGSKAPWKLYQNYALDLLTLRYGRIEDGCMHFGRAQAPAAQAAPVEQARAA